MRRFFYFTGILFLSDNGMKNKVDIIIVGAGICGLLAARKLSEKGKKVIILEARAETGGRIRSITKGFSRPVALGPEFIHGNLPITKKLLKEAGIAFHPHEGEFYRSRDGKIVETENMTVGWDRVMEALQELKEDTTLSTFLSEYFGTPEDAELRKEVTRLAEGFDAADATRISAFSVRDEWSGDSIEEASVVEGGYALLTDYLSLECRKAGCVIHTETEVKTIHWKKGLVTIECTGGQLFEATQVLITVSLGVLTSESCDAGHIQLMPELPEKIAAAKNIGFGPVIKINMELRKPFWNDTSTSGEAPQFKDLGFLNSESEIPTWWTMAPDQPFLVGWVGGSRAAQLQQYSDDVLCEKAINSLASALLTSETLIRENIVNVHVSNWGKDLFTKGAYSYETPETAAAKAILGEPVEDTIFFGGEALGHMGTVESALESALEAVKKLK